MTSTWVTRVTQVSFTPCTMRAIILALFVLLSNWSWTQTSKDSSTTKSQCKPFMHPSISAGMMMGGQFNSGGFYYKSGWGAYLALRKPVTNWLSFGIGAGLEQLQEERMTPIYGEVMALFNSTKPNSGFFILQSGYTLATLKVYEQFHGYEGAGGLMISPGWGYRIQLKQRTNLFFTAQYRQQNFHVEYHDKFNNDLSERFSYSMISLKIGMYF